MAGKGGLWPFISIMNICVDIQYHIYLLIYLCIYLFIHLFVYISTKPSGIWHLLFGKLKWLLKASSISNEFPLWSKYVKLQKDLAHSLQPPQSLIMVSGPIHLPTGFREIQEKKMNLQHLVRDHPTTQKRKQLQQSFQNGDIPWMTIESITWTSSLWPYGPQTSLTKQPLWTNSCA